MRTWFGQFHGHEILVDLVHQGLDRSGGIRRRRVAVHPSLGVDDIRYGMPGSADGIILALPAPQSGVPPYPCHQLEIRCCGGL